MKIKTLSALLIAGSLAFSSVQAEDDNFYEGKTIQVLVGLSAGGGYDSYARTLARHIGKHIPGNPDTVVRNVTGAGSMVLMNQLANTLPSDGTVFGTVGRGIAFEPMFGNKQAKFKPGELSWVGSLNNETSICASWHSSGVSTWQELRNKQLTVGSTGAGADTDLFPRVLSDLLDLKFVPIAGYPGGSDVVLAMERGEVQGRCGWSWSSVKSNHPDWVEDGDINLLLQMSLEKHPDLPDVPLVTELAETKEQAQVLNLLFARQVMGRPFVAPPGVPAERLAMLRQAFADTVKDPEFLQDIKNQNLEISYVSGQKIQDILIEAGEYSQAVIDRIANIQ